MAANPQVTFRNQKSQVRNPKSRAMLLAALYIAQEQYESVCERAVQVSRMIAGLIRHLRQSQMRGRKYS